MSDIRDVLIGLDDAINLYFKEGRTDGQVKNICYWLFKGKEALKADAIQPQRMPEGYVLVPQAALDWLNGEKPDADGKWFGECEDEATAPGRIFPRKFWWRSKFRELCALSRPECGIPE